MLSRYPLSDTNTWDLPPPSTEAGSEARILLRATVSVDGVQEYVYDTHLASPATNDERKAQADAILTHVDLDRQSAEARGTVFRPIMRLYATKRGERPLIRAAGGVCHSTPA